MAEQPTTPYDEQVALEKSCKSITIGVPANKYYDLILSPYIRAYDVSFSKRDYTVEGKHQYTVRMIKKFIDHGSHQAFHTYVASLITKGVWSSICFYDMISIRMHRVIKPFFDFDMPLSGEQLPLSEYMSKLESLVAKAKDISLKLSMYDHQSNDAKELVSMLTSTSHEAMDNIFKVAVAVSPSKLSIHIVVDLHVDTHDFIMFMNMLKVNKLGVDKASQEPGHSSRLQPEEVQAVIRDNLPSELDLNAYHSLQQYRTLFSCKGGKNNHLFPYDIVCKVHGNYNVKTYDDVNDICRICVERLSTPEVLNLMRDHSPCVIVDV
jgi:hypothetical protein